MTLESPSVTRRFPLLWATLAVVGALLILFHNLLLPNEVMFGNDAPLGTLVNHENDGLKSYSGVWAPDNWIGSAQPGSLPTLTYTLYFLVSPVVYAKIMVPLSLLILGISGAFFCQRAGFHPGVGVLTAVAAALNSNPFSYACWGLSSQALTLACVLFALGLLEGAKGSGWVAWIQVLLAGFCVGLNVMEGADVGAILSLYVAAYIVWRACAEFESTKSAVQGGARLALVAVAAGWISSHAVFALIKTQISGVSQPNQSQQSSEAQWQFSTGWSYPPIETIRILIPGVYGYRMDSPEGGAYWGGVGQDGTPQRRFNGDGEYAGALVLLIGAWGIIQSLRGSASSLERKERQMVWFWTIVAFGSLLLSFGRFASFYRLVFALPFFSNIRDPHKYLHGMHLALWILFAYGMESLSRGYLGTKVGKKALGFEVSTFDRLMLRALLGVVVVAGVGAMIYQGYSVQLDRYLDGFQDWQGEKATAAFSIREVWIAFGMVSISAGLLAAVIWGKFQRTASTVGWVAFIGLMMFDLTRANDPWVKHYDYVRRHEVNPIVEKLRDKPYEHRVTAFLCPQRDGLLVSTQEFALLSKEWLENHFQYYHIQSLDIDQMPRTPELEAAYLGAFIPPNLDLARKMAALGPQLSHYPPNQAAQIRAMIPEARPNLAIITRLWQLTNTRYVFGLREGVDVFNDLFDPVERRFKVSIPYRLGLKPGVEAPTAQTPSAEVMQLVTAQVDPEGPLALLEFTGALPRVQLFAQWETITNQQAALARIISPSFDPLSRVVLSAEVPKASNIGFLPGEATITRYTTREVSVKTKANSMQALLLNDRWHEDWHVYVDEKPTELLRANFIMRGVMVPAGEHSVVFRFDPPSSTLWVSLSALGVGVILLGVMMVQSNRKPSP